MPIQQTNRDKVYDTLTEREWQSDLVKLAKRLGWESFHPYDSRKSVRGWPDLALVRDRLVLIECKTQRGKCSEYQRHWIRKLLAAGVEVYIARPRQEQDLAFVLASRDYTKRLEVALRLREATRAEAERA